MKPQIDEAGFGWIQIDGVQFDHDVIIGLDGTIKKRKKSLSKAQYGTSHKVSLDEVQYLMEDGARKIVIGAGHYGALDLSDEARKYLKDKEIDIELYPTPEALTHWNQTVQDTIGLFHVTC